MSCSFKCESSLMLLSVAGMICQTKFCFKNFFSLNFYALSFVSAEKKIGRIFLSRKRNCINGINKIVDKKIQATKHFTAKILITLVQAKGLFFYRNRQKASM